MGIGALLGGRDVSRNGGDDGPSISIVSSWVRRRGTIGGWSGKSNKEQDASGK